MIQNLLAGLIPQNIAFPVGGMDIAFYAVAFIILVTAVCTVAVKNILQSAVFLIFSFVATAILYLLLHAEFTALAQVMVYVGGVVIFVVFTILLTSRLFVRKKRVDSCIITIERMEKEWMRSISKRFSR